MKEDFDRHDMQLNTPSGVVDLQSGAMRRHEAADMLTRLTCAEYPGILRWAVEGCRLWQREGLAMPQAVEDALAEYKSEMDVLAAFLAACTAPFGECQAGELYRVYVAWAKESNEYIMSATKFGREIGKKFEKTKKPKGIFLQGITLNEQYRPYKINVM